MYCVSEFSRGCMLLCLLPVRYNIFLVSISHPINEVVEDLPKPKGSEKKVNVDYRANNHVTTAKQMYDNGLIPEEDWELLTSGKYGRRIEIDNVIAYVGAERFWKESVITSFAELFNTADWVSLKNVEYVMLPNLRLLNKVAEKAGAIAAADEVNKLKQDYTDYDISTKGFIEDIDAIEKENTKRIEKNELEDDHIQWLEEQLASI
jgi:hypothetical protein